MQQDLELARIMEQHRERVRSALRRRGVAERDLPDAEQEVFLVVHRKLPGFEGRSSLSTWLHRIAINIASEHRRRAYRRHESLAAAGWADSGGGDPQHRFEAREQLARVQEALAGLSVEQREAFVLHELVGLTMEDVANELRVPLKTAFSRFYAARRNLLAALGRRGVAASLVAWLSERFLSRAHAHTGAGKSLMPFASVVIAAFVGMPQSAQPAPRHGTASVAPAISVQASEGALAASPQAYTKPAPARSLAASAKRKPRKHLAPELAVAAPLEVAVSVAPPPATLVVTYLGSEELRPVLPHPLAERITRTRLPVRVRVRSQRGAPIEFDDALVVASPGPGGAADPFTQRL